MSRPIIQCRYCGIPAIHRGFGYCGACYSQVYRTGSPERRWRATCAACDCKLTVKNRHGGVCGACYERARRRGLGAADIYAWRKRQPAERARAWRAARREAS